MAITLATLAWNGCASDRETQAESDADGAHAECPVCKIEGDLACVRVTIEAGTPRADLDGVTYYFCSTQCRDDFMREPERYLKH